MKLQNSALDSVHSSTTTSLASSSIDSSSSSIPSTSSSPSSSPRCVGLDLLVKAIYQVTAGSIIGVPYIQKRVIRRRSRRSKDMVFNHTMFFTKGKNDANGIGGKGVVGCGLSKKKKRAKKVVPSKMEEIQGSCIETWRPKSRYGRDLSKMVVKM